MLRELGMCVLFSTVVESGDYITVNIALPASIYNYKGPETPVFLYY